jgi:DNA repair exonuclease SbcCD ATPase subunit
MKLIRLKVMNWRHLPPLEIGPLDHGVTVIHGPNKAGKSSLVEAVKKGLFDKFKGKAEDIIPWSAPDAVPEVEVEFAIGDRRFRVLKKFSSRKAGGCELAESEGGQWRQIADGAEVDDEVRKLLRSSDKKSGVPQMLWVRQGEVDIPPLDDEFAGRLRSLLGSVVITETDNAVRQLINENLSQWFSPSTVKNKSFLRPEADLARLDLCFLQKGSANSPLTKLTSQIESDQAGLDDIERQLAAADKDMETAQSVREELLKAGRDVSEAEAELKALQDNEGVIEEKKKRAGLAQRAQDEAGEKLRAARQERDEFQKCVTALAECMQAHEACMHVAESGSAEVDHHKRQRDEARLAIRGLEAKIAELDAGSLIEKKQQILDLTDEMEKLETRRVQLKRLEDEIAGARSELQAIVIPADRDSKKISSHLDRRNKLRAELEASQLHFSLRPERDLTFNLVLDRGESQEITTHEGDKTTWQARQSLDLTIPGVGEISFGRGEENEDLEQLARQLDKINRELDTLLNPLGIASDASTPEIIAQLQGRKARFDALQGKISEQAENLKLLGTKTSAELEGEIKRQSAERDNLRDTHEELKTWTPSRSTLADEKRGFAEKKQVLNSELNEARARLTSAQEELDRVAERQRQLGEEAATAAAILKVKQDDLTECQARHESLDKLVAVIQTYEQKLETLSREYEKHKLTSEEESFGEQLRAANDLVLKRVEFRGSLESQQATLQERLRGLEGLHARKVGLEQKLAAAKREQARMETDVKALAILAQVFDRLRDSSIENSLKPVTEQIEPWLSELYGADAKKVVFGSGMQPEKIVTQGGEFTKFETVTSHGELEQLSTLVRLAYAVVLAKEEPQLVILDDPLAHSDPRLRRKMHAILEDAARKNLQLVIFTCNREGFDRIAGAQIIDLGVVG